MKTKYNDSVHVIEEAGVCKVIIETKVEGLSAPFTLTNSFGLADLLQTIIEKDPKLFREKVWKPLADKYSYPLSDKCNQCNHHVQLIREIGDALRRAGRDTLVGYVGRYSECIDEMAAEIHSLKEM